MGAASSRDLLAALVVLLSIAGFGSAARAGSLIAIDFGFTPPSRLYSISETGEGTVIGDMGVNRLNGLALSPSGEFITKGDLLGAGFLQIDPTTGATTPWPGNPGSTFNTALAFAPSGELFLTGLNSSGGQGGNQGMGLHRFDPALGSTSFVGDITFFLQGLDFAPDGTLYGWDIFAGLIVIDPVTGVGVDVNPSVSGMYFDPVSGQLVPGHIQALAFHPDGRLFGARDALWEINTQTGTFTMIGGSGFSDVRGLAYIPEPGTGALLGLGLLGLVLLRRRGS